MCRCKLHAGVRYEATRDDRVTSVIIDRAGASLAAQLRAKILTIDPIIVADSVESSKQQYSPAPDTSRRQT